MYYNIILILSCYTIIEVIAINHKCSIKSSKHMPNPKEVDQPPLD